MASFDQRPGKLNLSFRAGDPFSFALDFDPISLTGLTLSSAIRSVVSGSSVGSFSIAVTNAAAGQCNLSLSAAQTSALPPGTYTWELLAPESQTFFQGFVEVTR
jgi:hypothetical protein